MSGRIRPTVRQRALVRLILREVLRRPEWATLRPTYSLFYDWSAGDGVAVRVSLNWNTPDGASVGAACFGPLPAFLGSLSELTRRVEQDPSLGFNRKEVRT